MRRSKPPGWKQVVARQPRISLTKDEAMEIARAWWGEHAEVFGPDATYGIDTFCVGHWDHALPLGDLALDCANWPDLHLEGCGLSYAAAFRDADPRAWSAYCVRRRCIHKANQIRNNRQPEGGAS